jgi:hypothetical protein
MSHPSPRLHSFAAGTHETVVEQGAEDRLRVGFHSTVEMNDGHQRCCWERPVGNNLVATTVRRIEAWMEGGGGGGVSVGIMGSRWDVPV